MFRFPLNDKIEVFSQKENNKYLVEEVKLKFKLKTN